MNCAKRRIAIKTVAGLALAALWGTALAAQLAGTVVNLSGPLMAKKADGSVKVLALRSEVEQGDTLVSEKNTYAQIKFIDNSEITLRPGTTFTIEAFAYDSARPAGDSASFTLLKGGLRSVTGLLGQRNKEKFSLKTPAATIGIRGTTFIASYVPPGAPGAAATPAPGAPAAKAPGALVAGLHVFVIDGMIVLNNSGGSMNFSAGQFGFTPNPMVTPVNLPNNPGLTFSAPPQFSITASANPGAARTPDSVDCEVR